MFAEACEVCLGGAVRSAGSPVVAAARAAGCQARRCRSADRAASWLGSDRETIVHRGDPRCRPRRVFGGQAFSPRVDGPAEGHPAILRGDADAPGIDLRASLEGGFDLLANVA